MKRNILIKLEKWLTSPDRKPLVIKGARQVGKTYSITEFGKTRFERLHTFNFEEDKGLKSIFEKDFDPKRILKELSFAVQTPINIEKDLIFFDEVQECPKALTSLKYFCEDLPRLPIISAGSLLGIKLSEESFPVGKVEFLRIYPMNFEEFLLGAGSELMQNAYKEANPTAPLPEIVHNKLWEELLNYFVVGGMPQVVQTYVDSQTDKLTAFENARKAQKNLLDSFNKDFAKHSGKTNSIHIVSVFENVPTQLAGVVDDSTKRFRFADVIPGKRNFNALSGPIGWLENAGLITKVNICNRAEVPLKAFCKQNLFKLFIFDIGLLGAMLGLPFGSILKQDYGMTKGYLAENFVAQEFLASGKDELYSWTERNSEIEFLIYEGDKIIPVEVKSGHRTQAKSLRQYMAKYSPAKAYKLSANNASKNETVFNVPLYLAGKL